MDLNILIPNNSDNWVVKNRFLTYRKYEHIPICFVEDGVVYVFADLKIYKAVIKLVKHLMDNDLTFYLTTPELSNPSGIFDFHNTVIKYYLHTHTQEKFFYGFKNIDFDLIDNLVKWCAKENCYDLIKPNYDFILNKINNKNYNYYSNEKSYKFSQEIRDEFQGMYRDIILNRVL